MRRFFTFAFSAVSSVISRVFSFGFRADEWNEEKTSDDGAKEKSRAHCAGPVTHNRECFRRAVRTFVQSSAGYFAANITAHLAGVDFGDASALRQMLFGVGTAGVAAGIAAVMNRGCGCMSSSETVGSGEGTDSGEDYDRGGNGETDGADVPANMTQSDDGYDNDDNDGAE